MQRHGLLDHGDDFRCEQDGSRNGLTPLPKTPAFPPKTGKEKKKTGGGGLGKGGKKRPGGTPPNSPITSK